MEINVLIQKHCKIIPWKEYNNIWEEHTLLFLNHRGLNNDISPFLIIYVCVCVCQCIAGNYVKAQRVVRLVWLQ